jgi:hypothetical protein
LSLLNLDSTDIIASAMSSMWENVMLEMVFFTLMFDYRTKLIIYF